MRELRSLANVCCQNRENFLPGCSDLHLIARDGANEAIVSAIAILRCNQERLVSDEGWVFKLMVRSVTLIPNAEGCNLLESFGVEEDKRAEMFSYHRGACNRLVIATNSSSRYLRGLVLDEALLCHLHTTSEYACKLNVQIGVFPEDIEFQSILSPNDLQSMHLGANRRNMVKAVISKSLDHIQFEHDRVDRVGIQLILSRAVLSTASHEGEEIPHGRNEHAGARINWKAIDRLLACPTEDFAELARAADLDPATDFVESDLRFVDFGTCNLTEFNFEGANLHGADLTQAIGIDANCCAIKGSP